MRADENNKDRTFERRSRRTTYEPATERLKAQSRELQDMLKSTGLSLAEIARRTAVKEDSIIKFARGTMPASEIVMQAIRNVIYMEQLKRGTPSTEAPGEVGEQQKRTELAKELKSYLDASSALVDDLISKL